MVGDMVYTDLDFHSFVYLNLHHGALDDDAVEEDVVVMPMPRRPSDFSSALVVFSLTALDGRRKRSVSFLTVGLLANVMSSVVRDLCAAESAAAVMARNLALLSRASNMFLSGNIRGGRIVYVCLLTDEARYSSTLISPPKTASFSLGGAAQMPSKDPVHRFLSSVSSMHLRPHPPPLEDPPSRTNALAHEKLQNNFDLQTVNVLDVSS